MDMLKMILLNLTYFVLLNFYEHVKWAYLKCHFRENPQYIRSAQKIPMCLNIKLSVLIVFVLGSSIKYNSDSLQPATPAPWHRSGDSQL